MTVVEQTCLKPGKYPWRGKSISLLREDLAEYASNTQSLLDSGFDIPVYDKHGMPGAEETGPRLKEGSGHGNSALDGVGWLKSVKTTDDGFLSCRLKISDKTASEKIDSGSIKYTSPELRENFTHPGSQVSGRVIAHMALTNNPRTQDQGRFRNVDANAMQFSLDDYEGPIQMSDDNPFAKKTKPDASGQESQQAIVAAESTAEVDSDDPSSPPESPPVETPDVNPDMPKNNASEDNAAALFALLEEAGLPIASTINTSSDELVLHLITSLRTMLAAKDAAKVEVADSPEPEPVIEEPLPMAGSQFSADSPEAIELIALREDKKNRIEAGKVSTREGLVKRLAKMPKGIAVQFGADLDDDLGALQFSDDGAEEPMFTLTQVLDRIEKAVPRLMQFSADGNEATEQEHPGGDAFTDGGDGMTDEQADKIASEGGGAWSHNNNMRVDTPSAEREVSAV